MTAFDLSPFYRTSVGFDHLANMLDSTMSSSQHSTYPPYNIEVNGENDYTISLALAGFTEDDIDIEVNNGTLTISGKQSAKEDKNYLHQGIATRNFERKFNLAEHIEIVSADLNNGMLNIKLVREVPEEKKPRKIAISSQDEKQMIDSH